jgi:alpha-mannosidase
MDEPSRREAVPRRVTAHYVGSSHWDREWYQSFQDYRFRLVDVVDDVIELLERDPEYRCWHMDGQTKIIEDYLEVRPEQRGRLQALLGAGRLLAGPWYVMPDEFLPCGESLVRNLLRGHQIAGEYASVMKNGFVCDIFGHNSQLPQILHGFGIDTAIVWRGTGFPGAGGLFRWQASDGSEVLTYNFVPGGYGHVHGAVRAPARTPSGGFDFSKALDGLRSLIAAEAAHVPGDSVLLFDGGDHIPILPQASALLAEARKAGLNVLHSSIPAFFDAVRAQELTLPVCRGELRYAPERRWRDLIPGVLSSRIYLKQANAHCEHRLLQWAEPFGALAGRLGGKRRPGVLSLAWKYLLTNHPHDSICGCSIDQVHRDMLYRFDQCRLIADRATALSLRAIADRTPLPALDGEEDFVVTVFNPANEAVDGVQELPLYFRPESPYRFQEWFGYEPIEGFRLYDAAGEEIEYQRLDVVKAAVLQQWDPLAGFSGARKERVRVAARLRIPPRGWTTLRCTPTSERTRSVGTQLINDHTMGNELLLVRINGNGSLDLTDRGSGHTYRSQMTFEERADIGDGWYHGTAVNDEVYTSHGASADVALIHDGFAWTTFRVRIVMNVPERFLLDAGVMRRSEKLVGLEITSWLTLRAGSPCLEVRTEVDNTARDHRLRVLFPSGLNVGTYFADSPYDVVERSIALRPDSHLLTEPELETKPQYSFTTVTDGTLGLAVISAGQPESAVRDVAERPIALTLFRGFPRTVSEEVDPTDCEMLGRSRHTYWLYPYSGPLPAARLLGLGQRLAAGVECVTTDKRRLGMLSGKPVLPAVGSWLSLGSGSLVVTACKESEDGKAVIVRAFNPTDREVEQRIESLFEIESAWYADMQERPTRMLAVRGGEAVVEAGARKIVTIRLELGGLKP